MKNFRIDDEVKASLRPLTPEELAALRLSIQTDGCRDPWVIGNVLGDRMLADGHHRQQIWEEEHFPFTTIEIKFPTKQLLIEWVKANQAGRRNLDTKEMEAYRRGHRQNKEKQPHGDQKRFKNPENPPKSHSDTLGEDTAQKIADEEGVSRSTVLRDADFADAVDAIAAVEGPQAREEILSGASGMTKAEVIAAAPVLCERCKRVGAVKGCGMCKELRQAQKADKPKAAPKPAKPVEEMIDPHGVPIPKRCRDAWCDPWIQAAIDELTELAEKFRTAHHADNMNKRKKHYPHFKSADFIDGCGMICNTFDLLLNHLQDFRPAAVCPECQGKGCGQCAMSGLVHAALHAKLTEGKK